MKRHAPATQRNRQPILEVLQRVLPAHGMVLEIAAGTGEHAAFLAPRLPALDWQPTDADANAIASIRAWQAESGAPNLRPPLALEVRSEWPVAQADAIFCANMIHIAPWAATLGLMAGAGRVLAPGGVLVLYGPFRMDGAHTAPSNQAFDDDLRARNPDWGVRDLEDVDAAAQAAGLVLAETITMPANNFCVVWRHIW